MPIELGILSNHLILCRPLLLLSSIFPRIRVFSNELALHIRWQKYWSFSFSFSPSNEHLISFRTDWFDFLAVYPNCLNEEPGSVTLLAMWPWTYSLASSGLSFFILVGPSLSRRLYKISKWVLTGSFPVTVSVLGLRASETCVCSLRVEFLFPLALQYSNPAGFQSHKFWGLVFVVQYPQLRSLMCGLDPLLFGENFCACDYPPVCGHLPEGVPTLCLCPLPFFPLIFWPLCAACGIEYKPPAVEACSLNHWIAREVLPILFWFLHCIFSCENIFCCIQVILIDSCS